MKNKKSENKALSKTKSTNIINVGHSLGITNKLLSKQTDRVNSKNITAVKLGNEAIEKTLTISILNSILPKEIIYAEFAEGGAMGNSGGVILYIIREDNLICYETSLFNDEETWLAAETLLTNNQAKSENLKVKGIVFNYFYGGMGNHVFINKKDLLEVGEGHFIYINNGIKYRINSTVKGVFNHVVTQFSQKNKMNN